MVEEIVRGEAAGGAIAGGSSQSIGCVAGRMGLLLPQLQGGMRLYRIREVLALQKLLSFGLMKKLCNLLDTSGQSVAENS